MDESTLRAFYVLLFSLTGYVIYDNCLKPLVLWFRQRRHNNEEQNAIKAYRRGYGWAWAALKCEDMSTDEVEALSSSPTFQPRNHLEFDIGAQCALHDYRRYEMCRLLVENND